ncbi:transcriptional regulator [Desulfococcaceae bacterium HSG9]|nr:transcriptional regulator [Desulfococcaceae bacterium HSG9]
MIIRPIRTEKDYDEVMNRIDKLIDAKPGTPEYDELEVLSVLSEAYEEENYPIDAPDPIEALKCIMEWRNLEISDFEPYIGTKSMVSELFNHKRKLTLNMIIRLKKGLGISADLLVPDTDEVIPIAV